MKQCFKCLKTKSLPQFYTKKGMSDGHLNKCISCCLLAAKLTFKNADKIKRNVVKNEYQRSNPIKRKAWHLKHKYGITLKFYDTLLTKQNGLCALCKKPGILVVDHCHTTGNVRGLLHRTCNSALGLLGESVETLINAASYIATRGAL